MADAPDPDGAKDGAKDDAAPAAATPPDQGSAMELELSQALIEVRRLTLFQGRVWLARGTSPRRMLEQRVLRATSWKDFTEEEVAAMSAAMRHSRTSRLAAKARAEAEALAAEVSRRKKPRVHSVWLRVSCA